MAYLFNIKVIEGRASISPVTRLRKIRKFLRKNKSTFEYIERFYSTVQAWIPEEKIEKFEKFASKNLLCWNRSSTFKESELDLWGEKAFSASGLRKIMEDASETLRHLI